MAALLRSVLAGALLALLLRPPAVWRLRPGAHYWWLLLPLILLGLVGDRLSLTDPVEFAPEGLYASGFDAAVLLLATGLLAAGAGQRVMGWSIAVHAAAASVWIGAALTLIWWGLLQYGLQYDARYAIGYLALACGWWLLALHRTLDYTLPALAIHWRSLSALLLALWTLAPSLLLERPQYWYAAEAIDADEYGPLSELPVRRVRGSAEALIYRQPQMLAEALERVPAGVPGQVDAYFLAFGGDADEDVFRNEVEYAQALFEQRYRLQGRSLLLLNNPDTTADTPLASYSNLRIALAGLAEKMNLDEDLLILFMTSHGSEEHQFSVRLVPLPLDWIRPQDLRAALDAAGILWRVQIISACYSGGFVENLSGPTSLVITAARADRPSFGCGGGSEITYFGRAFLADALNQTLSLPQAFDIAREKVIERELARGYAPSHPQMDMGALMAPRLQQWLRGVEPGPTLAFVPAVPVAACAQVENDC